MDIKLGLQQIYEDISSEFSASRAFAWPELQVFIPYLQDGFKVLDLGCGTARILQVLQDSQKKFEYTGVDFSHNLIKQAKEKYPNTKFLVSDMTKIDFEENSFDMVFMIASFHHLSTKEERLELLNKINCWLKPNGYLFMTNWYLWQKKYLKYVLQNIKQKKTINDFFIPWHTYSKNGEVLWRYYHSFSQSELERLLTATNFKLEPKGVYRTQWNINCLVQKS